MSLHPTQDQRNTVVRKTIAISVPGTLATGTVARFTMPETGTYVGTKVSVVTAPTAATLITDIHVGGTTLYTTQGSRPTVAATEFDSVEAAEADVKALAADAVVEVIVDQVGATVAGADAVVLFTYFARAGAKI